MPRATIIVDVDHPDELRASEQWFAKWASMLTYRSENEGCGCCVNMWNVEGPHDAIADLPSGIKAQSAWAEPSSEKNSGSGHLAKMYGPPPDCKWFEVVRKNSPRKCIRPLSGELCLRALDDDPHVSVLINPSVTRDAFSPAGFPTRRWTVLSSPSLLSRLG